jgi:transglutaminase-like putative cysteine protease
MKTAFLTFILFAISHLGYAQKNYSTEYGKITQYEMDMKQYQQDPDAEAVVLYDFGEYFFQGDDNTGRFMLYMTRKTKIKILKEAGISYATFEIPYYTGDQSWESIYRIDATTYNMEGSNLTKTSLDQKSVYDEKVNDRVRLKKIALSNVRVGSIVEISYTIETPYYFNMREWNFQRKIPVVMSNLRYRAIPYYAYTYIAKGITKLDVFNSEAATEEHRFGNLVYREMIYDFGMANLPAFKDEEYITSPDDYMVNLNFQLSTIFFPNGGKQDIMTTWPAMCDDFLKDDDFGKYIKNVEKESKKILPGLNLTGKSPEEQVEIITEYVKSKYSWDEHYGEFANVALSDFMKQQTGNVGNINLLLTGLLKAAGIEAYPVILSTRENGAISQGHPFRQFFNYVIAMAKVGEKTLFIDATEPLLFYSDLPERCINVRGLVIKPKTEEWAVTRQKTTSISQKKFDITIDPSAGKFNADISFAGVGNESYKLRTNYQDKPENLIEYLKDRYKMNVSEVKQIEDKGVDKPFSFSFIYSNGIEKNGDKLFIQPFCYLNIHQNPFKQTKRTLPLDMVFIRGEIYSARITIPKGYKVEYLPENTHTDDALLTVTYNAEQHEDKIQVTASYQLKKNIYDAENYIGLKASFIDLIKKFSDMIVLVKE